MKIIVILATAMCVGSVIAYPQISDEQFKSEDVNPETEDRANEVQQAAESQKNEVKVQFADEEGGAEAVAPLTPLDEVENEDDENRNKRFLSSLGGLSGSGSSGSGSGNFLFDILRQAADGAARAAGTVYRVVAGTQSLGLGLSASRDLGPVPQGAAPAAASSSATAGSSTSAPAASGAGNLPPVRQSFRAEPNGHCRDYTSLLLSVYSTLFLFVYILTHTRSSTR
ncbi:uncharacterized protein LOC100870880 isoform X3 [Apis florea]|uniref:uncharacterized protein LOC100870880 isoform X3 n=1 Tax=Apis florea TaxID=7463 RepID=UPI0012FF4DDB|nr:uncharacterized protein LOC100870880 isoform X3 [Apis florea]XP_031774476.1 uncharacterized protein LOC100870880 isoform X3 [Apis florea]XP_031774477.1 uncharacterized protein LOC100870880 isoform X3 [Apis florea]